MRLSPMDRENLVVTNEHHDQAYAFSSYLWEGDDGMVKAAHRDCLDRGEEYYRCVWSLLDSKERAAIKRIVRDDH